jgi:hypothetical protein
MADGGGVRMFQRSEIWTQCEECRRNVDLGRAGGCIECRRVLCHAHLHGSFFRRLLVDVGARPVCVRCRRGAPPKP